MTLQDKLRRLVGTARAPSILQDTNGIALDNVFPLILTTFFTSQNVDLDLLGFLDIPSTGRSRSTLYQKFNFEHGHPMLSTQGASHDMEERRLQRLLQVREQNKQFAAEQREKYRTM